MNKTETIQINTDSQHGIRTEALELIKGEFSPSDAKEILLQLFGDKIKYHQLRNLSSIERFGEFDVISAKRLPELRQQEQKIIDLFQIGDFSEATIKIRATINIEITG